MLIAAAETKKSPDKIFFQHFIDFLYFVLQCAAASLEKVELIISIRKKLITATCYPVNIYWLQSLKVILIFNSLSSFVSIIHYRVTKKDSYYI